ncbi:MAG: nitrophenyl compound nitroreductase subunit ArsF family protein [Bacteroidales bacterium]|nr:nitrophenyl compound nitroreductase subunit ArsF family protein [Bacteroidales bacterium]MDP3003514.1 nitrophenyl compound nitroreductase subunit ArsF family protein [Bacteroidales bacterium]
MKNLILAGFLMLVFSGASCNAQPEKKQTVSATSGNDIEVYYFHRTVRCVTCKTVEAEARKNIEMLYADQVKTGKISFTALNLEEATGKTVGDKLGVSGQTLLIVKGDQKINITNEGFLYAVSKPDKFREIIKEKVDPLMK